MKKILIIVVLVAIIGGYTLTHKKDTADGKVIIVGAPLALTGSAATDALNIKRGMDLAKGDLAEKGINVEIIYEDDGTDPKKTVTAVSKLINIDKVDFLIGPTWSFLTDAASSIVNDNKIVSINPANTSEFANGGQYTFYAASRNEFKKAPFTKWLIEHKKTRVAAIVDKAPWGESNLVAIKAAAKDAGAEVVFVEEVPMGQETSIIPTALTKMIVAKPDVLITTGFEQTFTVIVKKTNELKIDIPILFSSAIVRGLVANKVISILPDDEFYETTATIDDSFRAKFVEKYGQEPGLYADRAYDSLMLLVEAMNNKGEMSLEEYLRNKINYKGYGAVYDFDEKGDISDSNWVIEKLEQN